MPFDASDGRSAQPQSVWPWLLGCFGLILLCAIGGGAFLWSKFSPTIRGAMGVATRTAQEHAAIEREFPFSPPDPQAQTTPLPDRFRGALLIREQFRQMFKPDAIIDPAKLRSMGSSPNVDELSSMTIAGMNKIMSGQTAAMRTARMSDTEFRWLIGQMVAAALSNAQNGTNGDPGDKAG